MRAKKNQAAAIAKLLAKRAIRQPPNSVTGSHPCNRKLMSDVEMIRATNNQIAAFEKLQTKRAMRQPPHDSTVSLHQSSPSALLQMTA